MYSIPQAMLWEFFAKGRWLLPFGFLVANLLPFTLYSSLPAIQSGDRDRVEMINIYLVAFPLSVMTFALMIAFAQGSMARLFTMPMSNASIVGWTVVPSTALLFVAVVASSAIVNSRFNAGWPLLAPACFVATVFVVFQSIACIARNTFWHIVTLTAIAIMVQYYVASKHGGYSYSKHYWDHLQWHEFFELTSIVVVSYLLAVWGISRHRSGQRLPELGILRTTQKWIGLLVARSSIQTAEFRSVRSAQLWSEVRQKAWVFPSLVAIIGFVIFASAISQLVQAESFGTALGIFYLRLLNTLPVLSVLSIASGLALGLSVTSTSCRHTTSPMNGFLEAPRILQLGNFQSTLPIRENEFARAILVTGLLSYVIGLVVWVIAFGVYVVLAMLMLPDGSHFFFLNPEHRNWFLPLSFLLPWISMSNIAVLASTGRRSVLTGCLVFALAETLFFIVTHQLKFWTSVQLHQFNQSMIALAICLVVCVAFVVARRRSYVTLRGTLLSALIALAAISIMIATRPAGLQTLGYLFIFAIAALVVAPVATMPLAISWNRHR